MLTALFVLIGVTILGFYLCIKILDEVVGELKELNRQIRNKL